ncbi:MULTISPECIES: 16S rRNA (cytosine(1402)-N(4))-methyltransferase RsmH [Exiguobacterium]|uniref:Ribosomal RNA small subunit methyltransferase H n=1 Tax=Exiguobacterium sibiricum (strain DSM 17290 / CCUG 55495 / CIP 109462 / JCM 13490 / 255-15) TaxID=262543 RepID=RSMH_EXIS2|nr:MULTISPECIES: 16S rRNA (cytosine(1402)-N(4))-methyltransferase RsmH [Exiguobacterium]B1YIU3.1 RecName: Full=Ribosomal RNA small subunit methyltransferase H; AltName: Full=16S rRNA m(4)C1402 methyltransferase; AltName: Full=rRNA (cytosine-N(4)-)-methyltransferase RsmH [Exiguobacterium sibiricum 255-15]ACB61419.1 S-adenosyl-methyltransferase MraW [Exiguobacterium sibiricum 255-15]MDW2885006.1 16S rRNA (cytosine(1402)-N(4))-methyltransferase RsmH [Exiguobacterium sibiricum]HCN56862.1 16S rRNA (
MFEHETVLKWESIKGLNIKPDGIYVDCTLGGAGHSEEIVKQLTTGHLYAFDQDDVALAHAAERLAAYEGRFTLIKSNFVHLKEELEARSVTKVDGILFDLGVSSPQLDEGERGFSYNFDARLDMRMDQTSPLSAYEVVNEWPYNDLVRILFTYGEEKFSKQIARKIEKAREIAPIETTFELVELIKDAIPAPARRKGGHPAKRTFQAIRIAVNDELNVFDRAVYQAIDLLAVGGRLCVITFHSLEDRMCKQAFKEKSSLPELPQGLPMIPKEFEPELRLVTRKPITAGDDELDDNRRSRSAKLRIVEKMKES